MLWDVYTTNIWINAVSIVYVFVKREKYARDKISIKHHSCLDRVGFTWEISQPEEESEPEKEDEEKKEEVPTLRARLFDTEILNNKQQEYIKLWETRYTELAGKCLRGLYLHTMSILGLNNTLLTINHIIQEKSRNSCCLESTR